MTLVALFLATGFLSGYVSLASGTAGSVAALGIYFLWVGNGGSPFWLFLGSWVLGVWSIRAVEEKLPGTDPGEIVIDEFCGFYVACMGLVSWENPVIALLAALFFFRVFDVLKPGPVGWAETVPGAWGIMLDDVMAGVCANFTVRLLLFAAQVLGYA